MTSAASAVQAPLKLCIQLTNSYSQLLNVIPDCATVCIAHQATHTLDLQYL